MTLGHGPWTDPLLLRSIPISEFAVSGPELKKLVALARKQKLSFAFNPGAKPEDHMMGMDKRKAPELVGRSVKKAGPGAKVCFGQCKIEQKNFQIFTEDPLPAMAKKVKAFLRANQIQLNVVVMDPAGSVLEQEADPTPDAAEEQTAPAEPSAKSAPDPRLEPLSRRHAEMVTQAAALPGPAAAKFSEALQTIDAMMKAGKLEAAVAGLKQIRAKMDKLAKSGTENDPKPEATPATKPGAEPAPVPKSEPEASPEAAPELTRTQLKDYAGRVAAMPEGPDRATLAGKLQEAAQALKSGDQAALARLGAELAADLPPQTDTSDKVLPIWRDAKERVDNQLNALHNAMRARDKPVLTRIADAGLHGITDGQLTAVQTALMDYDNATGESRTEARQKLATATAGMRKFLKDNPILPLLDSNPLGVNVSVRLILAQALKSIDGTVSR